MIKLQIIGNIGKDAIINSVGNSKVISFSVAHTEKYKNNNGEMVSKTTWVDCSKWGDSTAVAQYLKKGTQVYVEGTPEVKTFFKQDGTSGSSLTLRVISLQLLGGGGSKPNSQQAEPASFLDNQDDGNLPF